MKKRRKAKTSKKELPRKPAAAETPIRFYRANEKPYGPFSNLFRREISFDGDIYPTAEHAYQAGKALKKEVRDWLMAAPTPAHLAMAAHGLYSWDIVPKWASLKVDRMRRVLKAKFEQHADLRSLLLSTGTSPLVETATVDNAVNRFWGEVNGRGKNTLGLLLMDLRSKIQSKASRSETTRETRRTPQRKTRRSTSTKKAS